MHGRCPMRRSRGTSTTSPRCDTAGLRRRSRRRGFTGSGRSGRSGWASTTSWRGTANRSPGTCSPSSSWRRGCSTSGGRRRRSSGTTSTRSGSGPSKGRRDDPGGPPRVRRPLAGRLPPVGLVAGRAGSGPAFADAPGEPGAGVGPRGRVLRLLRLEGLGGRGRPGLRPGPDLALFAILAAVGGLSGRAAGGRGEGVGPGRRLPRWASAVLVVGLVGAMVAWVAEFLLISSKRPHGAWDAMWIWNLRAPVPRPGPRLEGRGVPPGPHRLAPGLPLADPEHGRPVLGLCGGRADAGPDPGGPGLLDGVDRPALLRPDRAPGAEPGAPRVPRPARHAIADRAGQQSICGHPPWPISSWRRPSRW